MTGPAPRDPDVVIRVAATAELEPVELDELRAMVVATFAADASEPGDDDPFSDDDWDHALGGRHVIALEGGRPVAHAALVERTIDIGGRAVRVGYVEAVATRPDRQGRGLGSRVMAVIGDLIRSEFELGMLGTGRASFYERLGWTRWAGPTFGARADGTTRPTPDDDGFVFVLATHATPVFDPTAAITAGYRAGDVW